jgi:hypothetical protein
MTKKKTKVEAGMSSIVLKPGPVRRVDLELELGRVKKKQGKEKPSVIRLTRQDQVKTRLQLVDLYFFFTKTTSF